MCVRVCVDIGLLAVPGPGPVARFLRATLSHRSPTRSPSCTSVRKPVVHCQRACNRQRKLLPSVRPNRSIPTATVDSRPDLPGRSRGGRLAGRGVRVRRARADRRGPPLAAQLRRGRGHRRRRAPRAPAAAAGRGHALGDGARGRRGRPLRAGEGARRADPHGADRFRVRRAAVHGRGPRRATSGRSPRRSPTSLPRSGAGPPSRSPTTDDVLSPVSGGVFLHRLASRHPARDRVRQTAPATGRYRQSTSPAPSLARIAASAHDDFAQSLVHRGEGLGVERHAGRRGVRVRPARGGWRRRSPRRRSARAAPTRARAAPS